MKKEAKERRTSLSKYAYEMVQRGRRGSKGIAYRSDNPEDDHSRLVEENHALREKLQNTSLILEKAHHDLEEVRSQANSDLSFVPSLISLFKNDSTLSNENIITLLHLKPDDVKVRDLFKSLNTLNNWQLIHLNAKGDWKWTK
ncbi:MAG: hypothetical protein ABR985_08780 [Methanotrichaceae archaeon]